MAGGGATGAGRGFAAGGGGGAGCSTFGDGCGGAGGLVATNFWVVVGGAGRGLTAGGGAALFQRVGLWCRPCPAEAGGVVRGFAVSIRAGTV
jgi:hypothetical protein